MVAAAHPVNDSPYRVSRVTPDGAPYAIMYRCPGCAFIHYLDLRKFPGAGQDDREVEVRARIRKRPAEDIKICHATLYRGRAIFANDSDFSPGRVLDLPRWEI